MVEIYPELGFAFVIHRGLVFAKFRVGSRCPLAESAVQSVFKRLRARSPIDFTRCPVVVAEGISLEGQQKVPKSLVQIHADEAEVSRRVNCFVERKRDEINENNVRDFIEADKDGGNADTDETCARVRSSVYRSKNASSHLKGGIYCSL